MAIDLETTHVTKTEDAEPTVEEKLALLKEVDEWSELRDNLTRFADLTGEWAGMPMPIEDMRLVVEPSYPFAKVLKELGKQDEPGERVIIRNTFWSLRYRVWVTIYENEDGRICYTVRSTVDSIGFQLKTIGASYAWGIEQEARALMTLAKMLPHHAFKKYLLTGLFLESSPRSNIMYVFRKLRPTIAMSMQSEQPKVLCTLCLHPIAYYDGTWAGAMCPTDDVIAHLAMMRGDEHMFWKRSNQHPRGRPESGL